MPIAQADILVDQSRDFEETYQWLDDAGAPADLTGYTAELRCNDASGVALFDLTTTPTVDGYLTISASTGEVTVTILHARTAQLAAGAYAYELELTSDGTTVPPNFETSFLKGHVRVDPEQVP